MYFHSLRCIPAFGSGKSRWMGRHSHEVLLRLRYMSSSAKILIPAWRFLTFRTRPFFLHRSFPRFLLTRHRKLSWMVKGHQTSATSHPAKGIFRARLIFLHPFRRSQKLKCEAIERWSALTRDFFVPVCSRRRSAMKMGGSVL